MTFSNYICSLILENKNVEECVYVANVVSDVSYIRFNSYVFRLSPFIKYTHGDRSKTVIGLEIKCINKNHGFVDEQVFLFNTMFERQKDGNSLIMPEGIIKRGEFDWAVMPLNEKNSKRLYQVIEKYISLFLYV